MSELFPKLSPLSSLLHHLDKKNFGLEDRDRGVWIDGPQSERALSQTIAIEQSAASPGQTEFGLEDRDQGVWIDGLQM